MHWRTTEDGAIAWSIGGDGIDGDGRCDTGTDQGDVAFRLGAALAEGG
jgi:hypothetical protein